MLKRHSAYIYLWLSLWLMSTAASAQQLTVTDEGAQPMIGVHIWIGDRVEVTDVEGQAFLDWSIDAGWASGLASVRLEYLGYEDLILSKNELQNLDYKCSMTPDDKMLEEVVIIGRTDAREIDLPYNVTRIKSESIFSSNAQNSADALGLNSGAYIQKSQLGGGSPILRGFEANKVLLVVDGVRMNNAIYRNGHLQNAITIDPAVLDQLEVIYGAGSLLYGSEALGGVIHFRTKTPLLDFSDDEAKKLSLNAYVRHNTADSEKTGHVDFSISRQKWGVLTSISYSDRGDLRTGFNRDSAYPNFGERLFYAKPGANANDSTLVNSDSDVQIGTAYNQTDLLQKWVYRPNAVIKAELNLQYSSSSDVPRYDALAEFRDGQLRFAEWNYGPQERLLIAPKLTLTKDYGFFEKANLILSYQKVQESRISRNYQAEFRENQIEDVQVLGATVDFNKRMNKNQKITYGADLHYNDVQSSAFETSVITAEQRSILTRYPSGGSQLKNVGTFIQHNWQNADSSLVWINGLRYSYQKTDILYDRQDVFAWPDYFYEGISSINSAVVGITGINYRYKNWLVKASTGTAFRSPNVDDLAKVRVNGDEVTVPNPDLDSENVWNSELTVGYRSRGFSFGLTGYYTRLTDAIVREDFTLPDGSTTYTTNGETLTVTANVNSSDGWVRGLSAHVDINPLKALNIHSSINIQKGQTRNPDGSTQPLGHIPPTYGRTSVSYTLSPLKITADWRFNAWKHIEDYGGSVDNPDLGAIDVDGNEVGAPAWNTFGVSTQTQLPYNLTLNLGVENILDTHYRPFASGVSSAGRHVVMALRYQM